MEFGILYWVKLFSSDYKVSWRILSVIGDKVNYVSSVAFSCSILALTMQVNESLVLGRVKLCTCVWNSQEMLPNKGWTMAYIGPY